MVLGCETLGFTKWNPCFQSVNRWVSETAPRHPQKWIFMQFWEGIHSLLQRGEVGGVYLVAGGRGTEATVLLWFARLTIVEQGLRALFSSKKWGYSLPSPAGRGWGWGCLFWVLEYRARRPCTTMFGAVRIGVKWFLYIYSFSCINIQYGEWI